MSLGAFLLSAVPKEFTGTGDISGGEGRVPRQFILVAGSAAAAATIKAGGTGGTVVFDLTCPANTTSPPIICSIDTPYLSAISGTGAILIVCQ